MICATCVHLLADYDRIEEDWENVIHKLFQALRRSSVPDYRQLASLADQASAQLAFLADQIEQHRENHREEAAGGAGS